MVTRSDKSVLASPTLAELYRRQGHPEMAERLLAGLDPTQTSREDTSAAAGDRRTRRLRTLLARVIARRRGAEGDAQ